MTARLAGFLAALFVGGILYANVSGRHAQRDKDDRERAAIIRVTSQHIADSVRAAYEFAFDSAKKAHAATIAKKDQQVNQAVRAANVVREQAAVTIKAADAVLADSNSTTAMLRSVVMDEEKTINRMDSTWTAERQANVEARSARDSSHAQQVALLRRGFDQTLAAKDSAAKAVGRAFAVELQAAQAHGIRVGRVEGGVGALGVLALLIYAIK